MVLLDCFDVVLDKVVVVLSQLERIRKQETAICYKALSAYSSRKPVEIEQKFSQLRLTFEIGTLLHNTGHIHPFSKPELSCNKIMVLQTLIPEDLMVSYDITCYQKCIAYTSVCIPTFVTYWE
jgi:hypothetical protein